MDYFSDKASTIIADCYPRIPSFLHVLTKMQVLEECRQHIVKTLSRIFLVEETLTMSQWSSSGNPVAIQCSWNLDPSVHWNAIGEKMLVASVLPVVFQWLSRGLPVCSNYANYYWIATGSPLGASIGQYGSSGIPVYLWLQWSSSVVCPVVSQCTDRIWFGGH